MRTLVIFARLAPLVLSFVRDHRRWLLWGAPARRTDEFHQRRAARLVRVCAQLGPTFIKLAQVLAARADLVPEPYLAALGTLVDRVPPVPFSVVEATIRDSYGLPPGEVFEAMEPQPLAAASLGQVHRASWRGRLVAVKVLRPGVERLVAADLRAAKRLLAPLVRYWPHRHLIALRGAVDEFGERIWEEMDFRREAAYAEEIGANFAGVREIIVPRVMREMTRQHVLVLEYVEGRRVDALAEWIADGRVQPRLLVRTVMEMYIRMMLVDGLFHADPHPGNLHVTRDGRLLLLDFGMVVRVPRETRLALVNTVFAAIRRDIEGLIRGFQRLGILAADADLDPIRELAAKLLALASAHATVPEKMEQLLADEVMHALYDAPVSLPSDLVYFARTAALIEGLGTRYDPYFNPIDFATPIVLRLRGRIISSLRGDAPVAREDWAATLGGLLGEVAGVAVRAGRELATIVGQRLLQAS